MHTKALRIFWHLLFWLSVYLLPYFVAYGKIGTGMLFKEPGDDIHALSTVFLIAYYYLNHYRLVPDLYLRQRYVSYAVCVLACVLVVIWLPIVILPHHEAHLPLNAPGGRRPGGGPPREGQLHLGFFKPNYNIVLFVISTFLSISTRLRLQVLEVQKEKLDAELSLLKAQINPHFLFNTLNSIYALSIRKSDDTPKAIIQLSELMRYIIKDAKGDLVPLDKELHYISNYIALQTRRLGNTVQINYSAPQGFINRKVAPLILMSFVENAFKHGVNPDQHSAITISITIRDKQLQLSVVNNKVTSVNQEEETGIGLQNATSRLAHLYPGKHRLTIDDGATTFSVQLILDLND